uniref:Uncharacterized protein n=1 Tax=Anguilla anguilla TaxID=7936 RepID=A0A0E9TH88_ANGAN
MLFKNINTISLHQSNVVPLSPAFFSTITTRLLLCRALCSGSSFILLTSDL